MMLKENPFIRLDFGLVGGVGYKPKNDLKSINVGVLYYYGIVDVKKQMP